MLSGTFTLRFSTGLTGALLIYFLADLPAHGGDEVSPLVIAVFTALFFAAELILSPPFGLASDRMGHHRVMQIGPVFGFVAVVLTALAAELRLPGGLVLAIPLLVGSLPLLALTRILEGASTAASVPSILGYLAVATAGDEHLRGRTSARFEAATIAGLGVGFAAAGPAWTLLGPWAFLANALIYLGSLAIYRYGVAAPGAPVGPHRRPAYGWRRYASLLTRSHVWLLAPTWVAINAALGLYTSQTLFQLVRKPDERFADQLLVGGFEPNAITAGLVVAGAVFFAGLWWWGERFDALRRTTIIFLGILGGAVLVVSALLLNHSEGLGDLARLPMALGLAAGLFVLAGATPAALGLLADISEAFPDDRGAIMGLYSVFLGVGQILGAFVGGAAAELWAFDGILVATLVLLGMALVPLARLRRFEFLFEPSPASGPDVEVIETGQVLVGEVPAAALAAQPAAGGAGSAVRPSAAVDDVAATPAADGARTIG
jgi:MFS family permease